MQKQPNPVKEEIKDSFFQIRWYIKGKMKSDAIKECNKVQDILNTKFGRGLNFMDCARLQTTLDGLLRRSKEMKES